MDVVFKGQHAALDDRLQEYARNRIERLERYLPTAREAVIEVRHEKTKAAGDRYIVQITLNSNGTFLRAEERAAEPRVALDVATDALGRQVRRHKDKTYRSGRATTHLAARREPDEDLAELAAVDDEEDRIAGHVVRVKRFAIKPMTVEEAVEQMELLGHNFFLFYDEDDRRHAVLYRRRDGDYGLILPETP
ncbi:MAG: ribosome-associated translation inhibitor RaiA [Dehalococcoidia bacterium]